MAGTIAECPDDTLVWFSNPKWDGPRLGWMKHAVARAGGGHLDSFRGVNSDIDDADPPTDWAAPTQEEAGAVMAPAVDIGAPAIEAMLSADLSSLLAALVAEEVITSTSAAGVLKRLTDPAMARDIAAAASDLTDAAAASVAPSK